MKRSFPYAGAGAAAQPPPPAGPAPPLPNGPAPPSTSASSAGAAQNASYANYGYGNVPQSRSASISASASVSSASASPANDAQQAQWHQQWQQYYAQQAASQQHASQNQNHAQPYSAQPAYNPYPQSAQQAPAPSPAAPPPAVAYPYQPHAPQASQAAPMHAGYPNNQSGYYGSAQPSAAAAPAPPSKRPRYDQPPVPAAGYPNPAAAAPHAQPYYTPSHSAIPSGPPGLAGPAAPTPPRPAQPYGWQQRGMASGSGPAPAPGMGPAGGYGRAGGGASAGGPARGRGALTGPMASAGGPSHAATPMAQGHGPQNKFRGASARNSNNGLPNAPAGPPFSARGGAPEVSGWGPRAGRSGGSGPGGRNSGPGAYGNRAGGNYDSHGPSGGGGAANQRRGGTPGSDRGGRSASGGGRNMGGHGPRAGFSSQNTIPINAPSGPNNMRGDRRDASKHASKAGGAQASGHRSSSAANHADAMSVSSFDQPRGSRAHAASSDPSVPPNTKRCYTDFRIRSIEIEPIGWSWSVHQHLADEQDPADKTEEDENASQQDHDEADEEDAGSDATSHIVPNPAEAADGADASASATNADDASSSKAGDADETASNATGEPSSRGGGDADAVGTDKVSAPSPRSRSQSATPIHNVEPPRGPKADAKKNSLEAKTARVRAAVAATVRDSTRLRINFAIPPNAGPEGAPTGPKADKVKAASAAAAATKQQQQQQPSGKKKDSGASGEKKEDSMKNHEPESSDSKDKEAYEDKTKDSASTTVHADKQDSEIVEIKAEKDTAPDQAAPATQANDQSDAPVKEEDVPEEAMPDTSTAAHGDDGAAPETEAKQETEQPEEDKEATATSAAADVAPAHGEPADTATSKPDESKEESWSPITKGPPQSSINRVTISYAGTRRRILIDAEAIKSLTVHRETGKIEIVVRVVTAATAGSASSTKKGQEWVVCKGVLFESREADMQRFVALTRPQIEKLWNAEEEGSKDSDDKGKQEEAPAPAPAEDAPADADADATKDNRPGVKEEKVGEEEPKTTSEDKPAAPSKTLTASLGPRDEVPPLYRLLPLHGGPASELDHAASRATELRITAYLDKVSPLVEAAWVKTGDLDAFLGPRAPDHVWVDKVTVVDPDPPPTMDTVLSDWAGESYLGSARDRRRFVAEAFETPRGLVEILARIVRGDKGSAVPEGSLREPLASALRACANSSNHNHASLAVLAIFDLIPGENASQTRTKVGEILMGFPRHLIFKTLDNLCKERIERTRTSQKRKRDTTHRPRDD